jgi:hypothetical protein
VHGAGAGLDHEQAVQAAEGHRAVHVEEARRRALPRLGRAGTAARWCRCEQLTLDLLVPPSRGSRWRGARSAR